MKQNKTPFGCLLAVLALIGLLIPADNPTAAHPVYCNPADPGQAGCVCFCQQYADETAYDDQYGTNDWDTQFWSCFWAQYSDCWGLENGAARGSLESRELHLLKPQFGRPTGKPPKQQEKNDYPFGAPISDEEFPRIAKADTEPLPFRVHVDKATHRIRFENETEDHVTIVVERKERSK